MMINKLMIGDWVNYKSQSSGKLQPIKIENIYGCEFNCEVENWNIISGKSISDTEPIHLTEEILVKNSNMVECFTGRLYWLDDEEHCAVKPYKSKYLFMYKHGVVDASIPIEFVHQLQHCMRLFGVEPLLGTNEIKL